MLWEDDLISHDRCTSDQGKRVISPVSPPNAERVPVRPRRGDAADVTGDGALSTSSLDVTSGGWWVGVAHRSIKLLIG